MGAGKGVVKVRTIRRHGMMEQQWTPEKHEANERDPLGTDTWKSRYRRDIQNRHAHIDKPPEAAPEPGGRDKINGEELV